MSCGKLANAHHTPHAHHTNTEFGLIHSGVLISLSFKKIETKRRVSLSAMQHLSPPQNSACTNEFNLMQPNFIPENLNRPKMSFERRSSADLILQAAEIAEQISGGNVAQYEGHFTSLRSQSPLKESTQGKNVDQEKGVSKTDMRQGKCSPPTVNSPTSSQPLSTESHELKGSRAFNTFQTQKGSSMNIDDEYPPVTMRSSNYIYHDYAGVPDSSDYIRKKTGGVTQPFPEKLFDMLTEESRANHSESIVNWLPHGRAFIVLKPKLFTSIIMPKYFRQTKLTSFQRQLNLYGFRRITQGVDAGAYYHELFLRGKPHLCMRMVRQKVKGTGHKQPTDVDSEPNFYFMPTVNESSSSVMPTSAPVPRVIVPVSITLGNSANYVDNMSPAVHAAQLLKDMATRLPNTNSLPPLPVMNPSSAGRIAPPPSLTIRQDSQASSDSAVPSIQIRKGTLLFVYVYFKIHVHVH